MHTKLLTHIPNKKELHLTAHALTPMGANELPRGVLNVAHHAFNVALAGRTIILLFFDILKNKKPSVEPNQITFFVAKIFVIFQNTVYVLNAHPASATLKA